MEKAYEAYKDSGIEWIGEIPESWGTLKIKHLNNEEETIFIDGDWIESKVIEENGIRYLTTGNIGPGHYKEQGKGFISEETFKELNCTEVYPGDLIISRLNKPIGRACIIPDLGFRIIVAVDNVILRPNSNFNRVYLMYLMNSTCYNEYTDLISRGATMQRISRGQLGNITIPAPAIQEQTQIAAYLDYHTQLIDSLIEKIEKSKEVLKEYRLSLVEKVLIDKKVNRIQLRHVANSINRPIEYNDEEYFTKIGMYNWNRGLFLYPKTLGQDLGDSKFQIIKEGDLIISGQFAWEGAVSLVTDNENDCIASHRFHVLNGKNDIILNEYLMAYFTSQEGHFILNDNSNGSAGRNRPLNINNLLKEKIPVPNLDIQLEIKKVVKKEQKNIVYSSKTIQKLKDYRQSLISEAVTGKIDVRDWQQPNN